MKKNSLKTMLSIVALSSAAGLLPLATSHAVAASNAEDGITQSRDGYKKKKILKGYAVTGFNSILGKPFYNWGEPFGPFNFSTMGVYNASGAASLPLNHSTPGSAVLATYVDPTFLIVTNANPEDVDPNWINVPLRDVPVNTDFGFVNTETLKGTLDTMPLEVAQAEPSNDITLEQWMAAEGNGNIYCEGESATIKLKMTNLIPNRMYSIFGSLGLPKDGSATTFFPIPLGGTPNMVVTDEDGDATYRRQIGFCPLNPESTNRELLTINVQYHANHQNYGAVPEPGFVDGLWQGIITFNHLQFPVNVELLD